MDRTQMLEARVAALEGALARLMRQARGSFAFSRSTAPVIDTGPVQTVQGRWDALSLRGAMPVLYHFGFSSALPVGGDKIVALAYGDRSQSVVIATGHQTYRYTGLITGETVIYDQWGRSVHLAASGIVVNAGAAPVNINNAGTVTIQTPLLRVSGDIQDNYPTNTQTMAAMRTIYDEHDHKVVDVQEGGNTITTTVPAPQM